MKPATKAKVIVIVIVSGLIGGFWAKSSRTVNEQQKISALIRELNIEGQSIVEADHLLHRYGYGLNRRNTSIGENEFGDGEYSYYVGEPNWRLVPFGLKRVVIRATVTSGKVDHCNANWESDLL